MKVSLRKNITAVRADELWGGKSKSVDEGEIFRVNLMDTEIIWRDLDRPKRSLKEEKAVSHVQGAGENAFRKHLMPFHPVFLRSRAL